jgi:hypothetical protein
VPAFVALLLGGLSLCGCASFWDDVVTNRNRDVKGYFKSCVVSPDPLEVIHTSTDGAKRGQALAALEEPLEHGGTQEQQERILKHLTVAALADKESLCRLGAIRALGKWKDPRTVKILEDAYLQRLPFTSEINLIVRQQVLESLVETGNSEARHLLIKVAGQPKSTGDHQERQQVLDERLCAVRGLARFKQYDATEALVQILDKDRDGKFKEDVALRDRAQESLRTATGKNLPAEATAWRDFLHNDNKTPEPGLIQRVVDWVRSP